MKERYPAFLTFSPYGEMVPNRESFVDLDYNRKDKFGLPLARRTRLECYAQKRLENESDFPPGDLSNTIGCRAIAERPHARPLPVDSLGFR